MPRKPNTPLDAPTDDASPEEKFEAFDTRAEVLHDLAEAAANEESHVAPAAQAAGVWAHEAASAAVEAPEPAPQAALAAPEAAPPAAEGPPLQRLVAGSVQFGRDNLARVVETTQALGRARSPQEALAIQARFAQDSAAATWRESLRLGALLQETAVSGLGPLSRLARLS